MNIMVYGWASMAGMGTAIWLMARLCRTTLRHPLLLVDRRRVLEFRCAAGVVGILAGDSTGYEWLEFPPYSAIVLFVAYLLIMSWAVLMFRFRRGDTIYITQWYLLGAFLWFPWLYAATQVMLFVVPVQGVMQAAVNWWYANNLLFLWFGAIGLGTAYYMIPKVIGRPVYSYHLATIGFWTYALFASWTGMQRLDRWAVPGLDDHGEHRGDDSVHHSGRDRRAESSHDDARLFPAHALQPDAALHGFRRDRLHRVQHCRRDHFAAIDGADRSLHGSEHRLLAPGTLRLFHDGDVWFDVLHRAAIWSAANGVTRR